MEAAEAKENELFRSLKMQLKLKTEMLKHMQAQNKAPGRLRVSAGGSSDGTEDESGSKGDEAEPSAGVYACVCMCTQIVCVCVCVCVCVYVYVEIWL